MKALAIVALVFAGVSIFVPGVGIFLAMLCSLMGVCKISGRRAKQLFKSLLYITNPLGYCFCNGHGRTFM